MDPPSFIAKWQRAQLSERAASQSHFIDLCHLLGVKTPAELDPTGEVFTFEKSVSVTGAASAGSQGQRGFADVWYKDRFGWEYKRQGKYATLADAYRQLNQYRDDLGNPPLLIVSDIDRTEIHTNFTGYKSEVHIVELARLGEPDQLDLLRRVFTDPDSFRPDQTPEQVTEQAATAIGQIAQGLRERGHDPHDAAHFLMKVMFCLFAEDVALLPTGLFARMLGKYAREPARLKSQMDTLFAAMSTGGDFGIDEIAYFNGGLFDDALALELTEDEIAAMVSAAAMDWGKVEPSVFGTLFERSLDPDKRSQIGAHYTSRDDIMLVIEPVIVRPLRREWDETQEQIEAQLQRRRAAKTPATKRRADTEIANLFDGFQQRLASVRVLDPACGSGNFLYIAIQQLLDLELEVIVNAARPEIGAGLLPRVRPTQLHGIEINPYAAELAQVVIWIGYLQWMRDNGFNAPRDPILEPIATIENRDAILAWADEQGEPIPVWRQGAECLGKADWPQADYIVGNPPFLGSRKARMELGNEYVDAYQSAFADLPEGVDYCCYWFELARREISTRDAIRAGLLATQGIRGGSSREVLKRIKESGTIFFGEADRQWVLDGAAVRISMVGFAANSTEPPVLDGIPVAEINSDLTGGVDLTIAMRLHENASLGFQGTINSGPFDLAWSDARQMLATPNPTDAPNADVLRPWSNGRDVTKRSRGQWIIDFGIARSEADAAVYDAPFVQVSTTVKPQRDVLNAGKPKYAHSSKYPFWHFWNTRPEMRSCLAGHERYLATPNVTKHRLFTWFPAVRLPSHQLIAFARSDDYFFGVLHSSIHELWARRRARSSARPRVDSATRPPPASRHSPSPGPRARSRRRASRTANSTTPSPTRPTHSTSNASAGSTRPSGSSRSPSGSTLRTTSPMWPA